MFITKHQNMYIYVKSLLSIIFINTHITHTHYCNKDRKKMRYTHFEAALRCPARLNYRSTFLLYSYTKYLAKSFNAKANLDITTLATLH